MVMSTILWNRRDEWGQLKLQKLICSSPYRNKIWERCSLYSLNCWYNSKLKQNDEFRVFSNSLIGLMQRLNTGCCCKINYSYMVFACCFMLFFSINWLHSIKYHILLFYVMFTLCIALASKNVNQLKNWKWYVHMTYVRNCRDLIYLPNSSCLF